MNYSSKIDRNNDVRISSKSLIFMSLFLIANGFVSFANAANNEIEDRCSALYAGIFVDAGGTGNQLHDGMGFANWGNPGSISNYDSEYAGGGLLFGKRFSCLDAPLRFEVELHGSKPTAQTNQLDPAAGDETAVAEFGQLSSFRLGLEQEFGDGATLILNAGLAHSRISNSVTDIDFNRTYPDGIFDPDDSFSDTSSKLGWVVGLNIETPLSEMWKLRFGASLFDFGQDTYYVNTSGNNPCGAGGDRKPCPYQVHNSLFTANLAFIREF